MPGAGRPRWSSLLIRKSTPVVASLLAAGIVFAWLGYLVTATAPNIDVSVFRPTVTVHALYAAFAIAYVGYLLWRRRLPGPTGLEWPVFALVIVYIAATAHSIYPRASLETTLFIGYVVVAFYAFSDFEFLPSAVAIRGLVVVGLAAAAYALYDAGSQYVGWLDLVRAVDGHVRFSSLFPPSVPRVHAVGDHENLLAMALNLSLPFAVLLALRPGRLLDRSLAAATAVVIVLALFFTLSRGAWLGAAVGIVMFAGLYVFRARELAAVQVPRISRPAGVAALLGIALVAVVAIALVASRWSSRPEWLFRSSLSPRQDAIKTGLKIFRDHPLLGAGPNTFGFLYDEYSGAYPIENIHSHDGYVGVLDDTGVLGALALAAGGALVVLTLVKAYRTGGPEERALVAACAAALVTLAVHSLVDLPNISKTALLPLALVLALAMRSSRRTTPRVVSPATAPRLLVLGLVPVLVVGFALIDVRHAAYDDSVQALARGDFTKAASNAVDATRGDSRFAAYQLQSGVTRSIVYLVLGRGGAPPSAMLDDAVSSFRKAVAREPRSAVGYANLAIALRMSGDRDGAVDAARQAMSRAPNDGTIAGVAGTVFEWAHLLGDARHAYSVAVTHDATLTQSPFWSTSGFRGAVRADAINDSFLTDCQKARVSAMYHGYQDDLQTLADNCRLQADLSNDPRARSDLAVALYSLGRTDDARVEAQHAVDRAPDNAYARTALGIALNAGGDIAAVRHQLMLGAYLGDPDAAALLHCTYLQQSACSPLAANVRLLTQPGEEPAKVRSLVSGSYSTSAPMAFDGGVQNYLLGILYYRTRFLRESPTSILVPGPAGEWALLASPRSLLIQQVMKQKER